MILDSLRVSVPRWAPRSASRMISSSESFVSLAGPIEGRTTRLLT